MPFGIGQPVTRTEDPRFLTGSGTYADDIVLPHQAYAVVVYSPHAHADIRKIDKTAAASAPGVLAVLTGADVAADGLHGMPPELMPEDVGGPPGVRTSRPILVADRVRHIGDRVAMVIAETRAQAQDAAELLEIDYEALPSVTAAAEAIKPDAPRIWDEAEGNVSFTLMMGDGEATEAALKSAHHVSKVHIYNNRVTANAMETRCAIGDYNRATDEYTLYTSTQNPHGVRTVVAQHALLIPEAKLRVIARDVGGGFGMKGSPVPEDALVVWAARRVGRPVKWTPSRGEAIVAEDQGRDMTIDAELGVDAEGRIQAMRWRAQTNMGAYVAAAGVATPLFCCLMGQAVYKVPALQVLTQAVFTNTPPTVPYRGAGRPEATYIFERLMDEAARDLGMDRAEIRRRNYIAAGDMPFETHTHMTYDTGEFAAVADECVALADVAGFEARRKASEAAGRKRGMGIAYYIDNTGIFNERMELRFDPGGSLTIVAGTFSHGQGHETAYRQLVNEFLGLEFDQINFVQGDTAAVGFGRGTYASRSAMTGGWALQLAADQIIEKGKNWAGMMLEASAEDIEFSGGMYSVKGTDKAVPITEVAKFSFIPAHMPIEFGVGLEAVGNASGDVQSYPNGCHICEVEIDPETGEVTLDRFAAVDDMGTVLNPLLLEGQVHGGIAQGVGQALMEDMIYEPGSGQMVTGSFMDYCMPRADDFPHLEVGVHPVPSTSNPLGIKGAGEGGTVGAVPAVISAILDAIGATDIKIPATPERVWRALNRAA